MKLRCRSRANAIGLATLVVHAMARKGYGLCQLSPAAADMRSNEAAPPCAMSRPEQVQQMSTVSTAILRLG